MVKGATERNAKYAAKNDADAVRIRFSNLKASMDTNTQSKQAEITVIQTDVRGILDAYGIAAIFSVPYQAVGMKCYGKSNRFGGLTLTNEITRVLNDYDAQGLDADVLAAIGALFGVSWSAS